MTCEVVPNKPRGQMGTVRVKAFILYFYKGSVPILYKLEHGCFIAAAKTKRIIYFYPFVANLEDRFCSVLKGTCRHSFQRNTQPINQCGPENLPKHTNMK